MSPSPTSTFPPSGDAPVPETESHGTPPAVEPIVQDLVEDVSIDGMCGVY